MGRAYDLVAIGAGPAGEKGAAQAAYFGKRVAIVEQAEEPGGAGINTGTVPSKTLRETALYFSGLLQRGLYGIDYSLRDNLSIQDLMHRERTVVQNEHAIIHANLARHGIELIRGRASLTDTHTVHVQQPDGGTRDLDTEIILVATGSSPLHPAGIPFDGELILDSDSILRMPHIPASMIVAGGGVIGCEYAALFAALGLQMTQVISGDRLLPFVDSEIATRLRSHLERIGVRFLFNQRVKQTVRAGDHVELTLSGGETLRAETALFAAGRRSNVEGLGLEQLGVTVGERGLIAVNAHYQTTVPSIYAAGDVIGFPALASTSMEQARVAMVHAFNLRYKEQISAVLPLAVYTIPEIAMAGLTQDACDEQQIAHCVGRSYFEKNPRGQIIGDTTGMLKLVFSPTDKRLLGVHLIGELASELIHIGAEVLAENGTIDAFINAVYNYPSLSDSYKYAAYDGLGKLQALSQSAPAAAGP